MSIRHRNLLRAALVLGAIWAPSAPWAQWITTSASAAGQYPMTLALEAQVASGATTIVSTVTVRVEKLMEESRRTRAVDGLKYGGYSGFLNVIRPLPAVGTVEVGKRKTQIKYAREEAEGNGYRLVLVADRPLFFLSGDATKSRAGYELAVVNLHFDAQGHATGMMAGAARVKPTPEGGVTLDDFAEAPVQLTAKPR